MARLHFAYACQGCGARFPKWLGRCPDCGAWNTILQEAPPEAGSVLAFTPRAAPAASAPQAQSLLSKEGEPTRPGLATGIAELDRVLGGGLLEGTVALLGGDPGIGKSTLVLQLLDRAAARGLPTLYISGEESAAQIRSRARRLGLSGRNAHLLAEVELERMAAEIQRLAPRLLVVDSIQTVHTAEMESSAGTVSQVRACAAQFIQHAKATGAVVLLVGHVTKEGTLAGPRTLEHMVDVVLYLEGQDSRPQRLLRCVKNRFGGIHEVGLFQMTAQGLAAVENPSSLFLRERSAGSPGSVVFAGMEGTRPLLIEIQALVGEGSTAYPRRTAVGVDPNRVALLQAVLEKHVGLHLAGLDLYVNVVGGLRLAEPALDAAVLAALLSSARGQAVDPETVVFGEAGLTGELRSCSFAAERLAEAARLGFKRAVVPPWHGPGRGLPQVLPGGLQTHAVATVKELAEVLLG